MNSPLDALIDLFFETEMLQQTPRSGFAFLGAGAQNVAAHSFSTALIALFLADHYAVDIDRGRLLSMALVHDLPEARCGDLNYVNKRYVHAALPKVLDDWRTTYPQGELLASLVVDYEGQLSPEAQLIKEADNIELLIVLRHRDANGNRQAMTWFDIVADRLQTDYGREIASLLRHADPSRWWQNVRVV